MPSKAATVAQYLAELPEDRRAAITKIREIFLKNLDPDIEESMQYGMIGYGIPHRIYPAGYHCDPSKPVPIASLASQKNHMSLGLMDVYADSKARKWFETAWKKSGKKLDMGACCVRFRKLDDVPLDVVTEAVRRMNAKDFIARYTAALAERAQSKSGRTRDTTAARSTATKTKSTAATATASKAGASKKSKTKLSVTKSASAAKRAPAARTKTRAKKARTRA